MRINLDCLFQAAQHLAFKKFRLVYINIITSAETFKVRDDNQQFPDILHRTMIIMNEDKLIFFLLI